MYEFPSNCYIWFQHSLERGGFAELCYFDKTVGDQLDDNCGDDI